MRLKNIVIISAVVALIVAGMAYAQPISNLVQAVLRGRVVADAASPTAQTAGNTGTAILDTQGRQLVNTKHPRRFSCSTFTASTTITTFDAACLSVASNSYYITDIHIFTSAATAAGTPLSVVHSANGCGASAGNLFVCFAVANGGCSVSFDTPIKVTTGNAICPLASVVGTKAYTINGYIAP
jgi:hypothetical protein